MSALGDSFSGITQDYDRGRPRYPTAAAALLLDGLPVPVRALDVGAGTGQMAVALRDAGAWVLAAEPASDQRVLLAERLGPDTVLDARAEALPVADGSQDLVTCADSFHWFERDTALAEFRRVLTGTGRLCLATFRPAWKPEESAAWAADTGAVIARLWTRIDHPLERRGDTLATSTLDGAPGFGPAQTHSMPVRHATDRDGLVALFTSFSVIASLADGERADVREELGAILDGHGVTTVTLSYEAVLTVASVAAN